jgi:rfaE bifunctional protein nucleotidyltransferase chain/domain
MATIHKIQDIKGAAIQIKEWKAQGEKVVFTNGCFDILHVGHVSYLEAAASMGTKLVVGINTDASVKRLGKGEDRPIHPEQARCRVLAALAFVDLVCLFDDDTPIQLIETFSPSVLVKGADYDPEEMNPEKKTYIVGSSFVRSYGGNIKVVPLEDGFSTTNVVRRMKQ